MGKESSYIEKLIKDLPYKKDKDGNPAIKYDFVKSSDYFDGTGLKIVERHFKDKYPKTKGSEYNGFNNLYYTGFFDDYFSRQYKTLSDLYNLRPDNFNKPVSLIIDDSNNRKGYVYKDFDGTIKRDYIPKEMTLREYLKSYNDWDEKLIAEKLSRVRSLQDIIDRNGLNNFIAKKGVKRLSKYEAQLNEYSIRKDVYKQRLEELTRIDEKINETLNSLLSNKLSHNNISLDNIIIYWNNKKEVEVGFINHLNSMDAKNSFLSSDKHRVKSASRAIHLSEFKVKMRINKYSEKYKSIYPGFRLI